MVILLLLVDANMKYYQKFGTNTLYLTGIYFRKIHIFLKLCSFIKQTETLT